MSARSFRESHSRLFGSTLIFSLICATIARSADTSKTKAPPLSPVFDKVVPENVKDLRAIQAHVVDLAKKCLPCVVNLRVGSAQGSGVIIRKEGYILTAGHVSKEADKDVVITLYNGKEVKGKTLGANHNLDSGLVKIVDKGDWPFAEMAKSADIKDGAWCLAVGHPGGLKPGRPPVVRLGRILEHRKEYLRSDCTLVGGDSGGPLFDMDGKVIGIHSRIGLGISTNLHVPVDTYRDTWDQLARGEVWGGIAWLKPPNAYMGVNVHPEAKNCLIQEVFPDSPAAKAGLKAKDVIVAMDGKKVKNYMELARFLANKQPGTTITVQARRGNEDITIRLVLGKRNA